MSKYFPMVPIGEVAYSVERPEAPLPGTVYRQVGVHLWGAGAYERESIDGGETKYSTLHCVESGDIIVNKIWARNGSVAVVNGELAGCFCSGEFPIYAPDRNRIEPRWFHWITKTSWFWHECDLKSRGTSGKNRIRPEKFLEIQIPLPPVEEQRRIVAKIDELTAKIEEARWLRQQTILDGWTLSESIRANIFKKMSSSWKVKKLDEVAPINMGQSPPGESYNTFADGIPLLNGPTEFGEKYPTPVQWTTAPTKLCKPGDILLCVRGATTGRLNWADKEYCIGRGLAALTPKSELCVPEYVYHFVETQTQEILGLAAGSTFPNLPGAKLKVLEIPVPPILEQRRVVAYLDSIQEKIKPLRYLHSQTAAGLNALLPSILDKAFKGEL